MNDRHFLMLEASQTSTNGSNNASLGCDGDMNTFSLTNSRGIQSWSMILKTKTRIKWNFISIGAGKYFERDVYVAFKKI